MRTRLALLVSTALLVPAAAASAASGQAGALDPSFAGDGVRLLDHGRYYGAQPVTALLPLKSGKTMVAARLETADGTVSRLVRLRPDGSTDPGFRAEMPGPQVPRRLIRLGEGRILLAGSDPGTGFAMTSYRHDGSRDRTFGYRGVVTTGIVSGDDAIYDVRVDSQQRILAAGVAGDAFAVVRYLRDGSRDPSFGTDGIVRTVTGLGGNADVGAMRLQPDGRLLVVGGTAHDATHAEGIEVMRFDPDGSVDETFGGGDGIVTTTPVDYESTRADAVVRQPDGRIVVGGTAFMGDNSFFCVARYLPDGSPDPDFGNAGLASSTIRPYYSAINALALQRDGRIVAAGWTDREGRPNALALARYRTDGRLDTSFSGDGAAVVGLGRTQDSRLLAVATRGGRITAGGETGTAGSPNTVGVVIRVRG